METQVAIKLRRSVRDFKPQIKISKDILEKLIDAGRLAPTARNIQPWEFIVITNKDMLETIGGIADNGRFIADASACIAVFCKDTKYYLEDGCAATENLLLAATDLGLDSCWVAGDKKPYCLRIKELLGVPDDFKLVS
ncbi:MAG: nitroreductase family protein, partial [Candidatus Omnitrophica bacterium]|nr:nitroreductase family protein [Candidatus Omnitrophota bacterium]